MGIDHTVLISSLDTLAVHDRTTRSTKVLHATPARAVDVIREGEERIRSTRHALELLKVRLLLLGSQGLGHLVKQALPLCPLGTGGNECLASHEEVDGVGLVGALGALLEGEGEDARVVPQPPVVGLVASQPGAVDAGLLARAETDDGTVEGVADRVGLGVLECQGCDDEVGHGVLGQVLVLSHDVGEERRVDLDVVAALLEGDAVDLARLDVAWDVRRVHLQHAVLAALLLLEDLESLLLVAGGDDSVRYLAGDDLGGWDIDGVRESEEVTERRHAVGSTGTGVGAGQGGEVLQVVNAKDLGLDLGEGDADGCSGGGDVLERSGSGEVESLRELLDECPGVESIKEVDVTWGTAEGWM